MLVQVSAAFEKRFKCEISPAGEPIFRARRKDSWSCHFIRVGRRQMVVTMHDATLHTIILPAKGLKGYEDFLSQFLQRIHTAWKPFGLDFDPAKQTVITLRRTDRSLIGSMNDAINLIRFYHETARENGAELDLEDMEQRSNETPYQSLSYEDPLRRLTRFRDEV